jgi:hypothetical protein
MGESRRPENAWRYDCGGGGHDDDSGREGGVMALNLDSPTPPPPLSIIRPGLEPPPRKLAKEVVVGNESATGPELASVVPKVAGVVEVIAGRWPEAAGGRRSDEGNGAEPGGC